MSAGKRESAPTPRSKVVAHQPQQDAAAAAAEAAIPSTPERRRSFAFMKYSTDRRSSTSMHRTREHARKIAMQLSQEASTFQPTFPTSYANNDDDPDDDFFQQQQTPHRRTNGTNQSLDAHYSSHIPQQQQQPPSSPYKISLSISVVAPSTPGRLPLPRSSSSEQGLVWDNLWNNNNNHSIVGLRYPPHLLYQVLQHLAPPACPHFLPILPCKRVLCNQRHHHPPTWLIITTTTTTCPRPTARHPSPVVPRLDVECAIVSMARAITKRRLMMT